MQDEGINVRAEFATDERDAMRHEAADEMYVTRELVELGDGIGHAFPLRRAPARAAAGGVERVGTLARIRPAVDEL